MTHPVLAEIERDMSAGVGAAFAALAAAYFADTRGGTGPVSTPRTASELAARFDEPIPRSGSSLADVLARLERDVLSDLNRLYHPMYMGHQVSAPLPAAVWSDSVVSAVNQSVAVWEMSPTATVLETQVIRWMCELAGFGSASGGTFTTGGTEATTTALLAARAAAVPDAWVNGVGTDPPVVVYGEHAHYAVARAVGEIGIGIANTVAIRFFDWRMSVLELERALARLAADGRRVMAVVATAGSTATGSFDDLAAIGRVCDDRGLWFHVDAAHGGSALLSARHRGKLAGIAGARTIAWDPHKMMLMPLATGVLLAREERDLEQAFIQKAPYLFHGSAENRSWDQGTRSWLCSRRADAVKVWVALQRYGAQAIGELYDQLCDMTHALYDDLSRRSDFETLHEPEANILCFRYLGRDGRMPADRLDDLNRVLRDQYNRSGRGWITATVLSGKHVLRTTMMNPRTTTANVHQLVAGLAEAGDGAAATLGL
ncbi:MAG: aspartate aminotransferase family protein [Gemmatimonadaceae bacterium]